MWQSFLTLRSHWSALLLLAVQLSLTPQVLAAQVSERVESSQKICEAELPQAVEKIINRPQFERSRWGILVQPLATDRNLYSLNARAYFVPASNAKLLTTAAALLSLGADYRIRTPIYSDGTPPKLTTLWVAGRGDPSLTTNDLKLLARRLKRQGINAIAQLIVEDSYFQRPGQHPTWELADTNFYYATAVSSLILNQNQVDLTLSPQAVGAPLRLSWSDAIAARQWQIIPLATTAEAGSAYSIEVNRFFAKLVLEIRGELAADSDPDPWGIAIPGPTDYFLASLRQVLEREGITVEQISISATQLSPESWTKLLNLESPPLAELIQETNQASNNLYAEVLLQTLGAETGSQRTLSAGLNALQQTLAELGVNPESYHLADGSGLSRHNFLSPEAAVQTLKLMARSPQADIYRNSLPLAASRGTLRRRFQDTPLAGNLRAKTGTMTGVSALSGYLDVPGYQPLVFSILLNRSRQPVSAQREAIDELVLLFNRLQVCDRAGQGQ